MAFQLQPPNPFDFKCPDEWPKWKRRFEQYFHASGLAASKDGARQVSTLLYCLGEDADDVLSATNISTEERAKYQEVMAKLDAYFKVRKNVIFERARFNRRNQLPEETAEEYITVLFRLVDSCDYGNLKDEMLRDRLVVGIRDEGLSQRLQMDSELTLAKAMKLVRQSEAVKKHSSQLKDHPNAQPSVDLAAMNRPPQYKKGPRFHKGDGISRVRSQGGKACSRCGKTTHPQGTLCPAIGVTCKRCKRKGHFASQCFSTTVRLPTDELLMEADVTADEVTVNTDVNNEIGLDTAFLDAVTTGNQVTSWRSNILIGNTEANFKLDTGAEATAITEDTYKLLTNVVLQKPRKTLHGPAKQCLDVLGQFQATLCHQNTSSTQTLYVIRGLKTNLLGLPAITSLGLLYRMDAVVCNTDAVHTKYPMLFKGLGTLGDKYTIKIKDDATPYSLCTPRNVAIPMREKVRQELCRMETNGVISRVTEPTPWCAGMVVVPKRDGTVRICVDFKILNESVLREVFPIPKVDDTLAQLAGATIFSKIDANSGFWQIPLAEVSRPLTTFITPYGRYLFNKLPFGISCAPELFQLRMSKILEGLDGVVCQMDDVLVFGTTQEQHDQRLIATLERIKAAGVSLNKAKCKFSVSTVKFLGHIVNKDGIKADPEKTAAVLKMKPPQNISELRRFLGLANQLGKFSCHLAHLTHPLRGLLSSKRAWLWGPDHDTAFAKIKQELTKPTVLALYQPGGETKVAADASSFGLGAVLLQRMANNWRPVAYASRALSETERRYAQIEKEALAVTWACTKFSDYLLGSKFLIETDHKPLVPLLNTKHLDCLPPRILRFRLRLAKYDYSVVHIPGKLLYAADALSRAPTSPVTPMEDDSLQDDAELLASTVISSLPASKQRLGVYADGQKSDPTISRVRWYCQNGWPGKHEVEPLVKPYWEARCSLTLCDDLLLFDNRIVVPLALQKETIDKIHEGHQGIERCRMRAKSAVWWPGMSKQLMQRVQQCPVCISNSSVRQAPLMVSSLPKYPWQVVGTDFFELDRKQYLVVVDYFSRYPEIVKMNSTTSACTIAALKNIFARYGIPEVVRSDNGPQYSSHEFAAFARSYQFHHATSSPLFPQSNGQVERMVQTLKTLLKKSEDIFQGLLNYRSTPFPWCNLSPAELLMGRKLRTLLPVTDKQLIPQWNYLREFKSANQKFKDKQKEDYDRRHRTMEMPLIPEDSEVWVTSGQDAIRGRVVTSTPAPRSYLIDTPSGIIRRNQQHLRVVPSLPENRSTQNQQTPDTNSSGNHRPPVDPQTRGNTRGSTILTRSRTGTAIVPPQRYQT